MVAAYWGWVQRTANALFNKERVNPPARAAADVARSCSIPDTSATWRMIMCSFEHKEAESCSPEAKDDSDLDGDFQFMGVPPARWMVYFMEHAWKCHLEMDDLGIPLF